jgi:hypothetical protein
MLWQIGKADRSNAEFALAPGDFQKGQGDGFGPDLFVSSH